MIPVAEKGSVPVRLQEGVDSGLAHIVQQYLEQDLAESPRKRRQARRLRGRVAFIASDYDTSVTVEFSGEEIDIWSGVRPPLDASIAGPYTVLTRLLQGEANPLVEHLRGRLVVRSRWRRPLLPLHVRNLMRLEPEGGGRVAPGWWPAAAVGLAVGAAVALALWLG